MNKVLKYSRSHPSLRYKELIEQYRIMHEKGYDSVLSPAEDTFDGGSLLPRISDIKYMILRTNAKTILDYGSGKGHQYKPWIIKSKYGDRWSSVVEYWNVKEVVCYDPAYAPFSQLPEGKFDGVISTEVLEHCTEEDLPWIIEEMFNYANCFVFASVASYAAVKELASGENAHCTVQPGEWWKHLFEEAASRHPGIFWNLLVTSKFYTPKGVLMQKDKFGNL